ncbi:armadillo-type protein [Pilobolus umbonatus]|nr:armadillo-type protein [Pilobolus umbonatus]
MPSTPLRFSSAVITNTPDNLLYDTGSSSAFLGVINSNGTKPQAEQRRTSNTVNPETDINKYSGAQLEDYQGKLYELCKDQNGCRFLQKKLEEACYVEMIYQEIHPHFVELMTDPFGNYLCQKLLEKCDDIQRTNTVEVIAPEFLKICLNMHGTRAVQRLIEFLSTKRQIQAVIIALQPNVVALIRDLNGNHVIQKCLQKLSPEYNQFIYDTVSQYCTEVATHRHGCCVLQRCIDYAIDSQKTQLVKVITEQALPLVQDPYGNYVVQYVLDLGDAKYSDSLIRRFIEPVRELSIQKFSSNVIEKCIRVSERDTRRLLINGLTNHPNMDKLLLDSYANYVIQTCLEYAEQDQRSKLIECIRPLLPSIRNTSYGKRIFTKIQKEIQQQQPGKPHRAQRNANSIKGMTNSMSELSFNGSRLSNNDNDRDSGEKTPIYL